MKSRIRTRVMKMITKFFGENDERVAEPFMDLYVDARKEFSIPAWCDSFMIKDHYGNYMATLLEIGRKEITNDQFVDQAINMNYDYMIKFQETLEEIEDEKYIARKANTELKRI